MFALLRRLPLLGTPLSFSLERLLFLSVGRVVEMEVETARIHIMTSN